MCLLRVAAAKNKWKTFQINLAYIQSYDIRDETANTNQIADEGVEPWLAPMIAVIRDSRVHSICPSDTTTFVASYYYYVVLRTSESPPPPRQYHLFHFSVPSRFTEVTK